MQNQPTIVTAPTTEIPSGTAANDWGKKYYRNICAERAYFIL